MTVITNLFKSVQEKKEKLYENTSYTHEYLLIILFLIISVYAYYQTLKWPSSTARWPKMVSGYIIIGTILMILRPYMPSALDPLYETTDAIEGAVSDEPLPEQDEPQTVKEDDEFYRRFLPDHIFAAIAITGYVGLGYLIGLFWATPIFILVYSFWFKIGKLNTAIVLVIGVATAYAFRTVINLPVMGGIL